MSRATALHEAHDPAPAMAMIPIIQIAISKTNPRRVVRDHHFSELCSSVKTHGILQPILIRPIDGDLYELVSGHRRHAAAAEMELEVIPAFIRHLTDEEALEIQIIENLQRSDLHPLEEAQGYHQLMQHKYEVARIAERIGRSVKYVYDRVKLLSLTKEVQKLFLEDRITAGHAIILARLKPADQKRALDTSRAGNYQGGPLFEEENTLFTEDQLDADEAAAEKYHGLKTKSVRELQSWVDKHVRFDAAAADVPDLFPETAVTVAKAKEVAEKIIPITHDHFIAEEARTSERVFGPASWVRADEKPCEHAVTGVIVVGPGRGEAFKVCTEKEKCKTHWAKWQKDRAKRSRSVSKSPAKTGEDRYAAETRRLREQQARAAIEDKRRDKARPAVMKAIAEKIEKTPAGQLAEIVIAAVRGYQGNMSDLVPRGKTTDDLVRHLAYNAIVRDARYNWQATVKYAKTFKVDANRILNEVAPAPKEEKPAAAKKAAKPKASKLAARGKKK